MKKDSTAPWWAQVALGVGLGALAIRAMIIDLTNNASYGATINDEMAGVMTIAALCVVALPTAAAVCGWNLLLRSGTVIAVAMTVWAAANAYTTHQGASILAAQSAAAAYAAARADAQTARDEAQAARDEAARITEAASAEQLGELVVTAKAKVASLTEAAKGRDITCQESKACRTAEADLAGLTQRLGLANAKAAALVRAKEADARATEAKQEAKAGPAEASMIATWMAAHIGGDANDVARSIALVMTALGIIATQVVALLAHNAATLIGSGWAARPWRKAPVKVARTKPAAQTGGPTPKPGRRVAKPKAPAAGPTAEVVTLAEVKQARLTGERARKHTLLAHMIASAGPNPNYSEMFRDIGIPKSTGQRWVKQILAIQGRNLGAAQVAAAQ